MRFELVCGNRNKLIDGVPKYMGTRKIGWSIDRFPKDVQFENKDGYVTAFFTTARGIDREIDIFSSTEIRFCNECDRLEEKCLTIFIK